MVKSTNNLLLYTQQTYLKNQTEEKVAEVTPIFMPIESEEVRKAKRNKEKEAMRDMINFWKDGDKPGIENFFYLLPSLSAGARTTTVSIRLRYGTCWHVMAIYESELEVRERLAMPKNLEPEKERELKKEICKAIYGHENFRQLLKEGDIKTDPREVKLSDRLQQVSIQKHDSPVLHLNSFSFHLF